jgi:HEPN domain-containing protein
MSDGPTPDDEFSASVFKHFMDQFITPEVQRRQALGELPRPLPLGKAQVVFYPDGRKPVVRINDEVRGRLSLKIKDGVTKAAGDPIFQEEVESASAFTLGPEDDPDCGHMTFVMVGGRWFGQFDFIYNKGLAERHLNRGGEFLSAAEHTLTHNHLGACIDNLFSAAELFAKAHLLLLSELGFRGKSGHKHVGTRYNYHGRIGNVEESHRDALNTLSRLRGSARYLNQTGAQPDEVAARSLCVDVRNMADVVARQLESLRAGE